ncbi:MAG: DNA replication and repair protein RecF [Chloroflexota bacterium]
MDLTNFRNYLRLELSVPAGMVILQGDNGQGKTNLLEAVYLLAATKSHRASTDRELVNHRALEGELPFARLCSQVQKQSGPLEMEIVIQARSPSGRGSEVPFASGEEVVSPLHALMGNVGKRMKVNGVGRRAIDVVGQVNVVVFDTQDIDLIGGSPALRRRYLDISISQMDRRYLKTLQRYNKVLLQRNHLLRLIQESQATPDELVFWDGQLVETGSYLIAQRQSTIEALNDISRELHLELTGGQEELKIVYLESTKAHGARDQRACELHETTAEDFREALGKLHGREIARGMTLVGPHRDDLQFVVDRVDMGVYGSRGQQRTIALSLHLAEASLMTRKVGEQPILLLDDVLSELDERRRAHLLESILCYQQVLLTTAELAPIPASFLSNASVFRVDQGTVEREAQADQTHS